MVLHSKNGTAYNSDEWTSQEHDIALCSEISTVCVPGISLKSAMPIEYLYLSCLDIFRTLTCLVFCSLIFQGAVAIWLLGSF